MRVTVPLIDGPAWAHDIDADFNVHAPSQPPGDRSTAQTMAAGSGSDDGLPDANVPTAAGGVHSLLPLRALLERYGVCPPLGGRLEPGEYFVDRPVWEALPRQRVENVPLFDRLMAARVLDPCGVESGSWAVDDPSLLPNAGDNDSASQKYAKQFTAASEYHPYATCLPAHLRACMAGQTGEQPMQRRR